jgi:perosamine synthetase
VPTMIPIGMPAIGEEEIEAVTEVLRSGMLAQGPRVAEFEQAFAKYCGVSSGVAVNSGTAALHAVLIALGIGPGDEVIVPAFTFFATASSVCMAGARPVFADVDPKTFNISIDSVQELVSPKTRAMIGVHLFGQPFNVTGIQELCGNIPLVEDAAQAHGAEFQGTKTGGLATAGCFSFYPTKNMTTGEGGMVTINDPVLCKKVQVIINHGQTEKYLHSCIGYNYRMSDISAAIGLSQLQKLDGYNNRRRETAAYYDKHIRAKGIIKPYEAPGMTHVYHQYVVRVTNDCQLTRDQLAGALHKKGIGTAVHYPIPLHRQPVFKHHGTEKSRCPVADQLAKEVLSLPVHPRVSDQDRKHIVQCINEAI